MSRLGATICTLMGVLVFAVVACGHANEREAYCGDDRRYVVEAAKCAEEDSAYFIYYGYWGPDYVPGDQMSQGGNDGRVPAGDAAARQAVGLPPRGDFGGNGETFMLNNKG